MGEKSIKSVLREFEDSLLFFTLPKLSYSNVRPMARVFERPRYRNQARNKLVGLAAASQDAALLSEMCKALSLSREETEAASFDYESMARAAMDIEREEDELPGVDLQIESYLIDSQIGRMARSPKLMAKHSCVSICRDFLDTFEHQEATVVHTDSSAVYYLLCKMLEDDRMELEPEDSRKARNVAQFAMTYQLPGQKIAPGAWARVSKEMKFGRGLSQDACKYMHWEKVAECLTYKSHPMWVKYCRLYAMAMTRLNEHTSRMVAKVEASEAWERHNFHVDLGSDSAAYNYAGVLVLYYGGAALVFDSAAAEYFRACVVSYRNSDICMRDYRLTADVGRCDLYAPYKRCITWIKMMLQNTEKAKYLPRHMHLAYTRWQNACCEKEAEVDCGWEERDKYLADEIVSYYPNNLKWYDMIAGFKIPERSKAELFKLYHLLPPPDIDPVLLHETMKERTSSANEAKPESIKEFINFCKAYDAARLVSKRRDDQQMVQSEGYDYYATPHGKKCMSGKFSMAPREEWGMFALSKVFPFDHTGDFHIFSAKDSTRVVANLEMYMDRLNSRDLSQTDQNELLSAIFRGSRLSNGEMMSEFRARVYSEKLTDKDHIIGAIAGKAENTKVDSKIRETLSACDIAREILTEVDHAMKPLAAITPGVSMRADAVKHKRKFQTMAKAVSKDSNRTSFATSTDVSGWSPKMPREMFHAWQDYALSTTECENPKAIRKLWDKLVIFSDRRGFKDSFECRTGNIQGWPATSDTTMHAHILIYWAYLLRERKILSPKEAAYTLAFIDDAATVVAVEGSAEEAKAKAAEAKEVLVSTYLDLGFVMDEVKSFFSNIKFLYLNELYVDGAQVSHSIKTMMRIDRDHTRRFASLPDHCAAAMGVASSAMAQGGDPFMCYMLALWTSIRLMYSVEPSTSQLDPLDLTLLIMAPVGLNGLGIRPITAVAATGHSDPLTWYIEIMWQLVSIAAVPSAYEKLSAVLGQESHVPSAVGTVKTPFSYTVETHRGVSHALKESFRKAARTRGMAEPFKTLDAVSISEETEAAYKSVLESGQYEAALLEEVGGSLPDAFVDEIMSRVDKTELVANMLGSRGIGDLRRRVRNCDVYNLRTIMSVLRDAKSHGSKEYEKITEMGSFKYAYQMRDDQFAKAGFKVLNHTYPCPMSLWAFYGEVDLESAKAQRMTTVSYDTARLIKTAGSNGKNLYDSALHHIGYKGYRSVSATVSSEANVLLYNPVRRKIASGLAAFRWAESNGAHYEPLLDLFLHSWSGHVDVRVLGTKGKLVEVGAKRLSMRHSKTNHIILAFPNTQGSVRVDARAITRAQAGVHHMHDLMGAITILRCAGLLEASLQVRMGVNKFAYGFTFKPESAAALRIPDGPSLPSDLSIIEKLTPFVDIKSDLSQHAKLCLSQSEMSRVLDEYLRAGARAAEKVYEAALENEELGVEAMEGAGSEIMQVRAAKVAMKYSDFALGRSFVQRSQSRVLEGGGVVQVDQSSTPHAVANTALGLDSSKAITYVSDSFLDTRAIHLALEKAVLAHSILEMRRSGTIDEIYLSEDWAQSKDHVLMSRADISTFIREVDEVRGGLSMAEGIALGLRRLGMPGFRVSGDLEDALHSVMSFTGRTLNIEGYLTALARSIRKLKANTSDEYSSITVSADSAKPSFVTKVIRAQWLLAAARYEDRANRQVALGDTSVGKLNSRTAFLRVAQRALKPTGNLSARMLSSSMVDRAIESVAANIRSETTREEFLTDVAAAGMDEGEDIESDEHCVQAVVDLCRMGKNYTGTIDELVMGSACQEVIGWVRADTAGIHKVVKFKATRLRSSRSTPIARSPVRDDFPSTRLDEDIYSEVEATNKEEPVKQDVGGISALFEQLGITGAQIGEVDEVDVSDLPPEVVMQHYFDKHWSHDEAPHSFWAKKSESKELYDEWVAELQASGKLAGIDDSADAMFAQPSWADEDGDWMNE